MGRRRPIGVLRVATVAVLGRTLRATDTTPPVDSGSASTQNFVWTRVRYRQVLYLDLYKGRVLATWG